MHLQHPAEKINFALDVLDQFTPLVRDGIEDLNKLKHNKELIKNSILYIYRELKIEPGKSVLKNHLNFSSEEKYTKYLDALPLMLMSLSNFSDRKKIDINDYMEDIDKIKSPDFIKDLEGTVSINKEKTNEYLDYLSEKDSINNDIKNGTNLKKIKYFDIE